MGTIHGVYSDFDLVSIILSSLATLLALLLLAMAIFRKDKRHLGDLLAHTQVQLEGDNKWFNLEVRKRGYVSQYVQTVDMFPMTAHAMYTQENEQGEVWLAAC